MISLRKYLLLSLTAAAAVFYHAFATRIQFFPAAMYLSTSKLAVAAVGNLSFAVALCMYNLVIKVFLGSLREIELERVKEKLSSAIMETCLALTIFREEFNLSFVGMFTLLTFVKVFHWLVQDRVDYIEVTPSVSRLAHTRIVSFLVVLLSLDICFLHHTIAATLAQKGHSVQLLFAFEYIILASAAAATFLKYILSMLDAAMEGRWDGKGTYVFYLELLTDMLHLFVYCIFFVIVFTNYGLPLHLIRDLYMTFRNFRNRITDFLRFRQVTARMDRFPDATPEDLARCDGICIICREEMVAAGLNKKLHCGHVFHLHCLRSWLERQQNCPTCRTSVFRPPPESVAAAAAARQQDAAAAAAGDAAVAPAAAGAGAAGNAAARGGAPAAVAPGAPAAAAAAAAPRAAAAGAGRSSSHRGSAGGGSRSRSRGDSGASSSSSGGGAPAAAGDAAAAAAAAGGVPGFYLQNAGGVPAGLVWQMPQWYPVTSMAAFSNAPLQYAGQQSALDQAQAQAHAMAAASMVPMVPAMIPAISASVPTLMQQMAAGAAPEHQHAAAAAAAMAAAAAAMYMPPMVPGLAMMPPAMLPAAAGGGTPGEQMAAAAAANAAAAAAAAAVMGGAAPPEVMQASFEATQQMLQRQLDYLQSQLARIRSEGAQQQQQAQAQSQAPAAAAAAPAPAAVPGASSAIAAPAAVGNGAAGNVSQASSSAAAAPAAAVQEGQTSAAESAAASSSNSTTRVQADAAATAADVAAGSQAVAEDMVRSSSSAAAAGNGAAGGDDADELRRKRLMRFDSMEQAEGSA